jgi:hypothetical protein
MIPTSSKRAASLAESRELELSATATLGVAKVLGNPIVTRRDWWAKGVG